MRKCHSKVDISNSGIYWVKIPVFHRTVVGYIYSIKKTSSLGLQIIDIDIDTAYS